MVDDKLTMERLLAAKAALADLPPLPQVFTYSLWPDDGRATVIEHEEGLRVVMHPSVWDRVDFPTKYRPTADFSQWPGVQVIDLDLHQNEHLRRSVMLDLAQRLSASIKN